VKRLALALCSLWLASGCQNARVTETPAAIARFHLESTEGRGVAVTLPRSGTSITIADKPVLTEYDIVGIDIAQVTLGKCLLFRLTPSASRDLRNLTRANPGSRLVLRIDQHVWGARRIDETIEDGRLFIFVEKPDEELPALQQALETTAHRMSNARSSL
jgi:hypothetical protein